MSTRVYFDSTTAGAVSPAFGGWGNTAAALVRRLNRTKRSSAMTSNTGTSSTGAGTYLVWQLVSSPIVAQTISGTVKVQVRCLESLTTVDAVDRMLLKIVSNDGTTTTGTLLALGGYGSGTEFALSLTNRIFANGDTVTNVTTNDGDRIVLELGYNRSATVASQSATINIGDDSGTDLPEDESTTATNNPWIEFSADIAWNDIVATGSITPTSGTVKTPTKILAGAITPTGALVKSITKILAGSITPVGALIKTTTKILAGAITPTGAVSSALYIPTKIFLKAYRVASVYNEAIRVNLVYNTAFRVQNAYHWGIRRLNIYNLGQRILNVYNKALRK